MSAPVPNPQAAVADPPTFEQLLIKLEKDFSRIPAPERFCFSFDGLDFEVRRAANEKSCAFFIKATIGYIPYTIESEERRQAIKTIIYGAQGLPRVHFGLDTGSRISACATFDIPRLAKPDYIFYPLSLFMQEAGPFIKLIGKFLSPASVVQAQQTPPETPKKS